MVCQGMLAPRKFMQKRRKVEVFKSAEDEADQKNWRKMMNEIDKPGSAVSVLRSQRDKNQALPKDLVLGSLVRFKQLKKWNLVSEVWTLLASMSFEYLLQLSSFTQTLANTHLCRLCFLFPFSLICCFRCRFLNGFEPSIGGILMRWTI